MTFQVQEGDRLNIDQMREFLEGSRQIEFTLEGKAPIYGFLERVLQRQHYSRRGRSGLGTVRAYLRSARI
jgi:hypothetical protein